MIGSAVVADAPRFLGRAIDVDAPPPRGRRASSVEAIADGWRRIGLGAGDLVIVALPNGVEVLDHFFGVCLSTGVPAIVSPSTPPARLRAMAEALGARAIVTRHLDPARLGATRAEPLDAATALLLAGDAPSPTRAGEVVLLTSGTSGIGSACVFDLDALLVNAELHRRAIGQRDDDAVLVSLPFYYSFALVAQALATLTRGGGDLVVGRQPFHVASFERAIGDHRIAIASLTPVQVRSLLAGGGAWPAQLRALTVGGDALSPRHVEALLRLPRRRELYLTYGLTQAGPRVCTLAAHAEPPRRFASVGETLSGVEVLLRPGDDGEGAELLVRTPSAMKRRLGRVEGRHDDWAGPGLLATGDVFARDADGDLYFRGRLSDFVVVNGEKVCLASIRRLAAECAGVLGARTELSGPSDAPAGYEIFLTARGDLEAVRDELEARLRRWLRFGERPLRVHVSGPAPGEELAYKA